MGLQTATYLHTEQTRGNISIQEHCKWAFEHIDSNVQMAGPVTAAVRFQCRANFLPQSTTGSKEIQLGHSGKSRKSQFNVNMLGHSSHTGG